MPDHLPRRPDVAEVAIRLDVVKRGFYRPSLPRLERRAAQDEQRGEHDGLGGAGSVQHLEEFQSLVHRGGELVRRPGGLDGAAQIDPDALLTERRKIPRGCMRFLGGIPLVQRHLDFEVI